MSNLTSRYLEHRHDVINKKNINRLKNKDISIIASNCAGGFIYHWLGLRFNSPFINLYLNNEDFITAMTEFDEFISEEIEEDSSSDKNYPVGIGYKGIKIHFMHYSSFDEAVSKWKERCSRINKDNIYVMLTNWNENDDVVYKFEKLEFKHKVIFTNKKYDNCPSSFVIKKWRPRKNNAANNIWRTQNIISGKRYIDNFDYISFFNDTD